MDSFDFSRFSLDFISVLLHLIMNFIITDTTSDCSDCAQLFCLHMPQGYFGFSPTGSTEYDILCYRYEDKCNYNVENCLGVNQIRGRR